MLTVKIIITGLGGTQEDIAIDNVTIGASTTPACSNPDVPSALSASPSTICPSATTTLSWTGALNDATAWHVYTDGCGTGQSITN